MIRASLLACASLMLLTGCESAAIGMMTDAGAPNPQWEDGSIISCVTLCDQDTYCMESHSGLDIPCTLVNSEGVLYRLFSGSAEIEEDSILLSPQSSLGIYTAIFNATVTDGVNTAQCFSGSFDFETGISSMTIFVREGYCIIYPGTDHAFGLPEGETITLN